jgi:hypothetical protein
MLKIIESQHLVKGQSTFSNEKYFTGKVRIKLNSCVGVPGKKSPNAEIFVIVRVDGSQKAKSKTSKKKFNEELTIYLEKAQEVEISVYEKGGQCLALMWFTIEMLVAEIIEISNRSGLIPKAENATSSELRVPEAILSSENLGFESWLDLEPSGRILLRLSLGRLMFYPISLCILYNPFYRK